MVRAEGSSLCRFLEGVPCAPAPTGPSLSLLPGPPGWVSGAPRWAEPVVRARWTCGDWPLCLHVLIQAGVPPVPQSQERKLGLTWSDDFFLMTSPKR